MTAIFVTGTGTDIGKTFVSAALIRHWRAAGRSVDAIKPVVSGFNAAAPAASDPGALLEALGRPLTAAEIDRIAPWRFAAALSPDLAARQEGRVMEFNALIRFCDEAIARKNDFLLIEGVGGVMVPLGGSHTVLDWMKALRLPLLLVTGSYLGTISHTLTALHVLAQRNLDIAAIVVSESESERGGATLGDTVATIGRFANGIEVVGVPRLGSYAQADPAFDRIARAVEIA